MKWVPPTSGGYGQSTTQPVVARTPTLTLAERARAGKVPFKVGDVVTYAPHSRKTAEPAIVRFAGTLGGKSDVIGIEFFADGIGQHDGFNKTTGTRGFTCPSGRGMYIFAHNPHLKRAEARPHQMLSAMGTNLEERVESNVLRGKAEVGLAASFLRAQGQARTSVWVKRWDSTQRRYLYFDTAKPGGLGSLQPPAHAKVEPDVEGGPEMRPPSIGPSYQGPHLAGIREGKVSDEEVKAMFDHVARSPDIALHSDYLLPLVWRAVDLFESQPSLVRIAVPAGGRVITLGDTHGHLKDILHVFRKYGCPSATNIYLINGDISDRGDTPDRGGQQGVPIWALVLCFKVLCPGSVFFNRGNHEDWDNNSVEGPYGPKGFHAEIHRKYPDGRDARLLKAAFRELFYSTPLAHVVGERVLVLHGGLWRAGHEMGLQRGRARPVRLHEVERVPRKRDIPCSVNRRIDMIMVDACWNDPHDGNGLLANPRGGNTLLFGGDVTASLCAREGLSLLVRSHDWPRTNPPHGHEWFQHLHGSSLPKLVGQQSICLSVFTASDYCGGTGNMGACIVFTGSNGRAEAMECCEWTADEAMFTWKGEASLPSQEQVRQTATFEDSLWELKGLVVEFKNQLLEEFQMEDTNRDFHVLVPTWIQVCERILGDCPWSSLITEDPAMGIVWQASTEPPSINYMEFLARYQIRFRNTMGRHAGFRRAIASKLYEALLIEDQPIMDTLASINPSGDGQVSVEEMQHVLSHVLPGVTPSQSWTMLRTMVAKGTPDGKVSILEFLKSFQMRFASMHGKKAPVNAPWVPGALPQIALDIVREMRRTHPAWRNEGVYKLLTEYFAAKDKSRTGYLEYNELAQAIWSLPCCKDLKQDEMQALVQYCDELNNGRINYLEFLNAFSIDSSDGMAEHVQEDNLEGIYRNLYYHLRGVVAQLLEQHIVPGEQRCTPREFLTALTAANATKDVLTSDQLSVLADTLSVEEDKCFDFRDFFASFEIIDIAFGVEEESAEEQ